MSFITLSGAQKALEDKFGPGVKIALEPIVEGKEDQLWRFDLTMGKIGRDDEKLFEAKVILREDKNYYQLVIVEEPATEGYVGHVGVDILGTKVIARGNSGLNGPIIELKPSSVSRGEKLTPGSKCIDEVETNPQRIIGKIKCCTTQLEDVELKPGERLTPIIDFLRETTDGRSISSLVKALVEEDMIRIVSKAK